MALLDPRAFLEDQVFTEKSTDGRALRLPPAGRSLSGDSAPSLQAQITGLFTRIAGKVMDIKPDIQRTRSGPCETVFEVNTARPGYLVFDESFAPGWRAWYDGKPETIFRAYGYWMAALVPEAGAHRIVFRYEPLAVRLGIFLSLVFTVIFSAGFLVGRWPSGFTEVARTTSVKNRSRSRRK